MDIDLDTVRKNCIAKGCDEVVEVTKKASLKDRLCRDCKKKLTESLK